MLTLLSNNTAVLTHNTRGIASGSQSLSPPLSAGTPRTMSALVNAMNSIRMLASPTHIPMRYFSGSIASSREKPGGQSFESPCGGPNGSFPPGPRFPPPAPTPGLTPASVVTVVGISSVVPLRLCGLAPLRLLQTFNSTNLR
jgi:hypothetical protein